MTTEVRARLRPRMAVVAAVLALAGTALTVQGARQEAAADTAESARTHATGYPESPGPESPGPESPSLQPPGPQSTGPQSTGPQSTGPQSTGREPPRGAPSEATGRTGVVPAPTASGGGDDGRAAVPALPATGSPAARLGGAPRLTVLPRSLPATLDIPSIGVHAPLLSLGLKPDGTVEVPPLTGRADPGWYRHSVTPGETGPAVILGHVDSMETGRGVFYRLTELTRGAEIRVTRADGSTAVFAVTGLERYPKAEFPAARVYGPTDAPTIRLVTCGGAYDQVTRTYVDNVVVYATALPATSAAPEQGERPVH
ncbi:class F sortase [Catenuloplanes sp. NPDC051500]|uniref:class F sortase n=1 Tax=Catenuloplanes sp. NPDC051500 TaxID=3363959 RepID=UPI003789001F